jgi:hypothetical protein
MLNIKKLLIILPFLAFASSAIASTGGGGLGNPTSPAPNCAVNDPAGNRKFTKQKASGRIDGMQALAQAIGVMPQDAEPDFDDYLRNIISI